MQPGDTVHPNTSSPEPVAVEQKTHDVSIVRPDGVSWEGSEYVDHQKPAGWYAMLVFAALAITGLAYLLTKDFVTTTVITIAAVLFGVMAARKPRTLKYSVGPKGITIDTKNYPYDMFKTFSVLTSTALHSVQLLPLKRFMPPLSLYFPPDQEAKIVETLSQFLPFAEAKSDPVDRLMARIRF